MNEQRLTDDRRASEKGTGIMLIMSERNRQIQKEGWGIDHDEGHTAFQLSAAAGCYIASAQNQYFKDHSHYDDMGNVTRFQVRGHDTKKWTDGWPWEKRFDKRNKHDIIRSLTIAGALIAAELDRLIDEQK